MSANAANRAEAIVSRHPVSRSHALSTATSNWLLSKWGAVLSPQVSPGWRLVLPHFPAFPQFLTYDHGMADGVGNLTSKVYDPSGANQTTQYDYDGSNRLNQVTLPTGTVVAYTYDGQGNRTQKSVTPSGGSATVVNDSYQDGLLQYELNGSGQYGGQLRLRRLGLSDDDDAYRRDPTCSH